MDLDVLVEKLRNVVPDHYPEELLEPMAQWVDLAIESYRQEMALWKKEPRKALKDRGLAAIEWFETFNPEALVGSGRPLRPPKKRPHDLDPTKRLFLTDKDRKQFASACRHAATLIDFLQHLTFNQQCALHGILPTLPSLPKEFLEHAETPPSSFPGPNADRNREPAPVPQVEAFRRAVVKVLSLLETATGYERQQKARQAGRPIDEPAINFVEQLSLIYQTFVHTWIRRDSSTHLDRTDPSRAWEVLNQAERELLKLRFDELMGTEREKFVQELIELLKADSDLKKAPIISVSSFVQQQALANAKARFSLDDLERWHILSVTEAWACPVLRPNRRVYAPLAETLPKNEPRSPCVWSDQVDLIIVAEDRTVPVDPEDPRCRGSWCRVPEFENGRVFPTIYMSRSMSLK